MHTNKIIKATLLALMILLLGPAAADADWLKLADVSGQPSAKAVKGGGSITTIHGITYLIVGNNTLDAMAYTSGTNTWLPIAPGVPVGPKKKRVKTGGCIADNGLKVFVFKGGGTNEFYGYDPETLLWDSLAQPGFVKGVKGGFAAYAKFASDRYIYAGSGANNSEWSRFNTGTGAWETPVPATLPVPKVKIGSSLAFDDGHMYFLRANARDTNFYAVDYESGTPVWTALSPLPLASPTGKKKKVKEGGCLQVLDGKVYAVKGGSTKEFWRYDPATNAWAYIGEVGNGLPFKGIKCGTSLARGGDGLHCLIGHNTNEFWAYTPPVDGPGPQAAVGPTSNRISLTASPNPGRGAVRVTCARPTGTMARLAIYSTLGDRVFSSTSAGTDLGTVRLPAGHYVMEVRTSGAVTSAPLVILN